MLSSPPGVFVQVLVPATGNMLKYERVEMFYHREPNTVVKFVRIETESGKALSLTRKFRNRSQESVSRAI